MSHARDEASRRAFAEQSQWCVRLASPFTALLCDLLGRGLNRSTQIGRRVLDWPGDPGSAGDARDSRNGRQLSCAVLDMVSDEVRVIDYPDPRYAAP